MLVARGLGWWTLALVVGFACHGDTPEPGESSLTPGAPSPSPDAAVAPAIEAPPELPDAPAPPAAGAASDAGLAASPAPELPAPGVPEPADAGDAGVAAPPLLPDTTLPAGVVSRFPRGAQSGVCLDAPLRLSFAGPVTLGSAGSIRVFARERPDVSVDAIDLGATPAPDTLAGRNVNRVLPIFIDGNDAVIYLRRAALVADTDYDVQIDAGVFVDGEGRSLAAGSSGAWSFRTGAAASVSGGRVLVDRENGDFCTIQGALDALGNGNGRIELDIQPGTYHELVYLSGKRNVTLHGSDPATTIISYPNNDRLNPGTAQRAMVTALEADGLIVEGLTLHNTTPQGGSQAEALRVRGERVILRRSRFLSLQDTLLLDGSVYVGDSYIEGNVDFVWGYGSAYFERSEIKVVGRPGVIVQARNGAADHGYVFVDSRLTSDPGIGNTTLARIDASEYPDSEVAFINCQLGPHITAEGWTVTGDTAAPSLRFLEYQSSDLAGQRLNVSQRNPASRQLNESQAAALRDKPSVLGGWNPDE